LRKALAFAVKKNGQFILLKIVVKQKIMEANNRGLQREGKLTPTTNDCTNLINLIKFADYVESNIRKFILEQRKKNRKKLLNSSVLQEARNDADKVTEGVELLIVNV
jgi:hypothetical protein